MPRREGAENYCETESVIDALRSWYLRRARHPFKAKIVGRFWGALSSRPVWITYDHTLRFKVDLRDYLQQKIFFDGYYEPTFVDWLKRSLRATDVFWDVGANVGAFTLIAARMCRHVVAFEPEPGARRHLEENIASNRLPNVSVVPYALSDSDGRARLVLGPAGNAGMHSIVRGKECEASISVDTRKADTLLKVTALPPPTIMKVDVEGAEHLVLSGARTLLESGQVRAIVFEASEATPGKLLDKGLGDLLLDRGYEISVLGYSDERDPQGICNFLAMRIER